MKKVVKALAMVSLAALSLSVVAPAASAADAKGKTVYLITMDKMDQHWVKVDEGAKTMAAALGLKYKWDAPDVKDNAKQIEAVNNAVADKANLILLAANDPKAISAAANAEEVYPAISAVCVCTRVSSGTATSRMTASAAPRAASVPASTIRSVPNTNTTMEAATTK